MTLVEEDSDTMLFGQKQAEKYAWHLKLVFTQFL